MVACQAVNIYSQYLPSSHTSRIDKRGAYRCHKLNGIHTYRLSVLEPRTNPFPSQQKRNSMANMEQQALLLLSTTSNSPYPGKVHTSPSLENASTKPLSNDLVIVAMLNVLPLFSGYHSCQASNNPAGSAIMLCGNTTGTTRESLIDCLTPSLYPCRRFSEAHPRG